MTPCIDVGIDAERDASHASLRRRNRRDAIQLPCGLGVDRADFESNRRLELVARLPHTGEHDVFRGKAGPLRHVDFAPRVGIRATAERAQQTQQRQSRIGLQRVVNRVRILGKRRIDLPIGASDRFGTVDIRGRANGLDDGGHADAVAEETCWRGLER